MEEERPARRGDLGTTVNQVHARPRAVRHGPPMIPANVRCVSSTRPAPQRAHLGAGVAEGAAGGAAAGGSAGKRTVLV
jgi:hypothetical protein